MMTIPLLLIGLVAYLLLREKGDFPQRRQTGDDSSELLKSRYVKGEVDEETYKKMLMNLKS